MAKSMRPGGGGRFAKLKGKLKRKGVRNPGALAASIGRKKYGKKKMSKWAGQGRKRAAKKRKPTRRKRTTRRKPVKRRRVTRRKRTTKKK